MTTLATRPDLRRLRAVRAARLAADRRCPLATAVVWQPVTIGPVPEEMDIFESLRRRVRVDQGTDDVEAAWRLEGRRRSKAPTPAQCRTCDAPVRWGVRTCDACRASKEATDADDGLVGAEGPNVASGLGTMLIAALVVLGVLAWTLGLTSGSRREAPVMPPCTVIEARAGGAVAHRC